MRVKNRYGGEIDERLLGALFQEERHFHIEVKHDLQYYKMQQACEEFAALDHSTYDVFVCIIMSHNMVEIGTLSWALKGRTLQLKI